MVRTHTYKTKQREEILIYLESLGDAHVTAKGIAVHLSEKGVRVSTATIYRHLDALQEEGLVRRLNTGSSQAACFEFVQSEACRSHFHLRCTECSRLIHLDCGELENVTSHIADDHGFSISTGRTVLYGTCKDCDEDDKDRTQTTQTT